MNRSDIWPILSILFALLSAGSMITWVVVRPKLPWSIYREPGQVLQTPTEGASP